MVGQRHPSAGPKRTTPTATSQMTHSAGAVGCGNLDQGRGSDAAATVIAVT